MRKLLTILMFVMMIGLVTPSQDSLGTYKQGEDVILLQICGTCSYNNITSIVLPNSTHLEIDTEMTKRGMEYTYTFSQTDLAGTYLVNGFGDLDGTANAWAYEVQVTENGLAAPTENIIIFFSIFFFIIVTFILVTLYGNIIHLGSNDTDLKDVGFSLGSFFALLTFYYFSGLYFPKPFVMDLLIILISTLGFTHVFVPFISLIFSTIQRGKIE